MSNLDIARAALVYARDGLHEYKSSNKINTKSERSVEVKRGMGEVQGTMYRMSKSQAFGSIEKQRPGPGAMMDVVVAHGRAALKSTGGNCQEYTAVVCHYLDMLEPRPVFDAVYLEPPGDHTFAVIGQQADGQGGFPSDFGDWHAQAAVCDPWANLICWARDYPQEWKAKMRKWANDGKLVSMAGPQMTIEGRTLGKPTNATPLTDAWYYAPERYRKLSFTYSAPVGVRRRKKPCYITTAVCASVGLPDDCEELTLLRAFRDDVLCQTALGRRDVEVYYATAPAVVDTIDASADPAGAYAALYTQWLRPAVRALKAGDHVSAYRLYKSMVAFASRDAPGSTVEEAPCR